jgi:alanyl-tRNA synthetase
LSEILERIKVSSESGRVVPGDVIFKFYDTFGLPLDLMQEIADENQLKLDEAGFNERLEAQRERGRASWTQPQNQPSFNKPEVPGLYGASNTDPAVVPPLEVLTPEKTTFVGYTDLQVDDAKIVAIHVEGKAVQAIQAGEVGEIFLNKTPFYAEAGGQVGDTGTLEGEESEALVQNTYAPVPGYSAHLANCIRGSLRVGEFVRASVDVNRRSAIRKNHTATHLLHASLRNLIGFHVKQAGSLVAPDRLRFDFSHYTALSPEEVSEIEDLVNSIILQNSPVNTSVKDLNAAISEGAMALFGEKYGGRVRVVSVDNFSKELCGGTHVLRTGDIGLFKVISEGGIAAGVRRIEAITGPGALNRFRESERLISRLEDVSRGKRTELPGMIEKYQLSIRSLEKEVEELKYQLAKKKIREMLESAVIIKDVKVLTGTVDDLDKSSLRNLADELKSQLEKGVVVLATSDNNKVSLVATVTPNLSPKVHAGKLAKEISSIVGGSGGGRPEMAEAGGKDPAKIHQALEAVGPFVETALKGL